MKKIFALLLVLSLAGLIIFISCKKEYSCEGCIDKNKPPIAIAGSDKVITLPTDSIYLDGSASKDPDGKISEWLWTKISGPASFNIIRQSDSISKVKALVVGTYQFELKVTDNGGLSAKDTIQVILDHVPPLSANSVIVNGCNATMTPFEHLPSAGGVVHAAAAGNKVLFVRYTSNGVVDIYDTTTHGWSTVSNMYSTYGHNYNNDAVTISNKIIYSEPNWVSGTQFNGQLINIYDASTNAWATNVLPEGRDGYTKAIVGNKAFYAGGATNDSPFVSKKIDIYDAASNAWSVINFPEARIGMSAASIGNKIFFAGGYITRYDSLVLGYDDFGNSFYAPAVVAIDKVDIFDVVSNTWSAAHLSEPRGNIATAVVGHKIVFASGNNQGGYTSSVADIYNAATDTWTNANLSGMGNRVIGAYSVGNKVLINYLVSDKVDIYDATNNSWSLAQMPKQLIPSAQERTKAAVIGNKILFYTIFTTESDSKNVDMYDASTNTWCHALLSKRHIRAGVISYGGRIYIAGGFTDTNCCTYDTLLDTVWFFNF